MHTPLIALTRNGSNFLKIKEKIIGRRRRRKKLEKKKKPNST